MNEPEGKENSGPGSEPTLALPVAATPERSETLDISLEGTGHSTGPIPPESALPVTLPRIPGYEIQQFVARGGMGMVYKAREVNLRRTVAIKVPRADYCDSPEDLQRFLAEAQAAALLEHPNICPVYRVGEFEGRPFIAMGFVEGDTLKAWREARPPAPRDAATMVARLARAVDFAHQRKVLHRDLKPSNVMIRAAGNEPVLMDFGLAKNLGEHQSQLTTTGAILGTPAFMAPEQAAGKTSTVGPAADIYSLGAILYDLLCGRPPFVGSVAEVLHAVRATEPVAPRKRNAAIPRDLETICLKSLAKDPARRYSTAKEMAEDLERFTAGESIRARRELLPSRMIRQARRHPLVTALAVLLLSILAGVAGLAPSYLATRRKSLLLEQIQSLIDQPAFAASELAQAEPLVAELSQVAPDQAGGARQRVHRRLAATVQELLRARQLSADDKQALAATFNLLDDRDKSLADPLRAQRDARFQGWNPLISIQPPNDPLPALSPAGVLQLQENGLAPPQGTRTDARSEMRVARPATTGEDCRLEATFTGYGRSGGSLGLFLKTQGTPVGTMEVVRFSRDGAFLYCGGDGGLIHVWDAATGKELDSLPGHQGRVLSLVAHPTQPLLFSGGDDGLVKVWDLAGKQAVRSLQLVDRAAEPPGNPERLPLAISRDGKLLVAAWPGGQHEEIRQWSLPSLQPLPTLAGNGSPVQSLALSPDGKLLAAGTRQGAIQIWNIKTAAIERTISDFSDPVRSLMFHPENRLLAAGSRVGIVRTFNVEQGMQQARLMAHEASAYELFLDRGGSRLVVAYDNGIRFWNLATQQMETGLGGSTIGMHSIALSPDGSRLAAAGKGGFIHVWDLASGREAFKLGSQGYAFVLLTPQVSTLPAGQTAALQGQLRILRDGQLLTETSITLPADPLRLRASIEAGRLRFQLNNSPELMLREYIPHAAAGEGGFSMQLPPGVALAALQLDEKPLPAASGPLERADRLLAGRDYQQALDLYQQQVASLTTAPQDAEVRTELQCKIGYCLLQLNRTAAGHEAFRQILATPGTDPYILLAGLQLWSDVAHRGDFDEAARVFRTLEPNFPPEQVARIIPLEQRRQILHAYMPFLIRNSAILQAGSQIRLREAVEMARFLQTDLAAGTDFHLRLIAFEQMAGNDAAVASLAAEALTLLEKPASPLFSRSLHAHELETIRTYGYLCRRVGDPDRAIRLIDEKISGALPKLSPEQQRDAWPVLVERACLNVARQDLPAAEKDLERFFSEIPIPEMTYDEHSQAWLLRGFVRDGQGDAAGAATAWKTASTEAFLESHPGAKAEYESSPRRTILVSVIGSLSDTLSDAQAADLLSIGGQVSPDSAFNQVLPLMLGNPRNTLAAMWRSTHAKEQARLIACREQLFPEQVRYFAIVAAAELLHQLCVPGELSEEHADLIWRTCNRGLDEYSQGDLPLLQLVPLLHRFRGNRSLFSDSSLLSPLSDDLRPAAAYFLAQRLLLKNKDVAAARDCLGIAISNSAEGSPLRKLAEAELAKLPPK